MMIAYNKNKETLIFISEHISSEQNTRIVFFIFAVIFVAMYTLQAQNHAPAFYTYPSSIGLMDLNMFDKNNGSGVDSGYATMSHNALLTTAPRTDALPAGKQWLHPLRGINAKAYIWSAANPQGFLSDASFQRFASWKVNVVHLEVCVDFGSIWNLNSAQLQDSTIDYPPIPPNDPLAPYRKNLQGLDTALVLAKKYDIRVIPFLTVAVGRKKWPLFDTSTERSIHVTIGHLWEEVAKKHGNDSNLMAYNLYDEPFFDRGSEKWSEMVQWLTPKIRTIDTATYLLVTSTGRDPFAGFSDPKTGYVFNYFNPVCYTHQGFMDPYCLLGQVRYPNTVTWEEDPPASGKYKQVTWTASVIRQQLDGVRALQQQHNLIVFCGGITVIRQAAPSESQWIRDVLEVFEENGWSWSYHGYGGWEGWNITIADDAVIPVSDPYMEYGGDSTNERFRTVSAYWRRNAIPVAPTLLLPPDNTTDIAVSPMLTWNQSPDAVSYRLQVSADTALATTQIDQANITITSQTVTGLSVGTRYFWRVNAANAGGTSPWSAIWSFTTTPQTAVRNENNADGFYLGQNYPNPFPQSTAISYRLPAIGHVRLEVLDIFGRTIATLVDEEKDAGEYSAKYSVGRFAEVRSTRFEVHPGVYFYRLTVGKNVLTRKMIVMK